MRKIYTNVQIKVLLSVDDDVDIDQAIDNLEIGVVAPAGMDVVVLDVDATITDVK